MAENFADRLHDAVIEKNSRVLLGLDPHLSLIPWEALGIDFSRSSREQVASGILTYCQEVVRSCADVVAAVKPQVAFFERLGPHGWDALESLVKECQELGLIVISDSKRGDIGSTAKAYAAYHLGEGRFSEFSEGLAADAMTCSAYLGIDTLEVYDKHLGDGKGIFVLSKTSNPGSGHFQDGIVSDHGIPLHDFLARSVGEFGKQWVGNCGYSAAGIVVGATHKAQAKKLRDKNPDLLFLVPGFGAQGATANDVSVCFDQSGFGAIVNASRSLMFAFQKSGNRTIEWGAASADAAEDMRRVINNELEKR